MLRPAPSPPVSRGLAITLDRQLAEDAVHDALLHLLAGRHRPDDPSAYVGRAVRNAAIDIARSKRREERTRREFLVAEDGPSYGISPGMLADAFASLRRAERETVVLHVYAGMSFQEIADLRGRSINTITTWYRRGLRKLRAVMKVENG